MCWICIGDTWRIFVNWKNIPIYFLLIFSWLKQTVYGQLPNIFSFFVGIAKIKYDNIPGRIPHIKSVFLLSELLIYKWKENIFFNFVSDTCIRGGNPAVGVPGPVRQKDVPDPERKAQDLLVIAPGEVEDTECIIYILFRQMFFCKP